AAGRSTATIDRVTGRQRAVRARVLTEALGVDASMVQAQQLSGGTVNGTPRPLDELTRRSAQWLARSAAVAERHTAAVVADPFDRAAWEDVHAQSAALRELAAELAARHPGTRHPGTRHPGARHPGDLTDDLL